MKNTHPDFEEFGHELKGNNVSELRKYLRSLIKKAETGSWYARQKLAYWFGIEGDMDMEGKDWGNGPRGGGDW